MQPFKVNWMLRAICEAQNDNAAHAALAVWIHKDKGNELTNKLINELRQEGENTQERLYKLRKLPRIIHQLESKKTDFMIDVILNPITGTRTLSMKGLLDSGCTSS